MIRLVYAATGTPLEPRVVYLNAKAARRSAGTKLGRGWAQRGYAVAPAAPRPPPPPPLTGALRAPPERRPLPADFKFWETPIWGRR